MKNGLRISTHHSILLLACFNNLGIVDLFLSRRQSSMCMSELILVLSNKSCEFDVVTLFAIWVKVLGTKRLEQTNETYLHLLRSTLP